MSSSNSESRHILHYHDFRTDWHLLRNLRGIILKRYRLHILKKCQVTSIEKIGFAFFFSEITAVRYRFFPKGLSFFLGEPAQAGIGTTIRARCSGSSSRGASTRRPGLKPTLIEALAAHACRLFSVDLLYTNPNLG